MLGLIREDKRGKSALIGIVGFHLLSNTQKSLEGFPSKQFIHAFNKSTAEQWGNKGTHSNNYGNGYEYWLNKNGRSHSGYFIPADGQPSSIAPRDL